jgi:hypothetical protein
MDNGALEWWTEHKAFIFDAIKRFPADPTREPKHRESEVTLIETSSPMRFTFEVRDEGGDRWVCDDGQYSIESEPSEQRRPDGSRYEDYTLFFSDLPLRTFIGITKAFDAAADHCNGVNINHPDYLEENDGN